MSIFYHGYSNESIRCSDPTFEWAGQDSKLARQFSYTKAS